MVGQGRGNWHRWNRKTTVEETLTLDIKHFSKYLHANGTGTIAWPNHPTKPCVEYSILRQHGDVSLMLHYQSKHQNEFRVSVRLQTTTPNYGGTRWWLSCPATLNGKTCNRRVAKLYLPAGGRHFACRSCHDLTYQSSQEAHFEERILESSNLRQELGYALASMIADYFGGSSGK